MSSLPPILLEFVEPRIRPGKEAAKQSAKKASKTKDIEHKSAKKQNAEQALVEKKEDLDATQKELDAALFA